MRDGLVAEPRQSGAGGTGPENVKPMRVRLETRRAQRLVECCLKTALGRGGHEKIVDPTTLGADDVVVVADDVDGELIASRVVDSGDSSHDAHALEVGHVAIKRALSQTRPQFQHLRDGCWPTGAKEEVDEFPPAFGVELASFTQAGRYQVVGIDKPRNHQHILLNRPGFLDFGLSSTLHDHWVGERPSVDGGMRIGRNGGQGRRPQ